MLTIRPEGLDDHHAVFEVHHRAFGRVNEARLVEDLRRSPAFISELSLVALDGPRAVGHILMTRMVVRTANASCPALALAPVAVLPELQGRGIGSALVRQGLQGARDLGHRVVIVVGHPGYYPRFGFLPAERFGIRPPFVVSPGAFMVLELQADALRGVQGEVEYPPEFARV